MIDGPPRYSASVARQTGGYPRGAVVRTPDGHRYRSLVDKNLASPPAAGWQRL